jgi:hypothetical protein
MTATEERAAVVAYIRWLDDYYTSLDPQLLAAGIERGDHHRNQGETDA